MSKAAKPRRYRRHPPATADRGATPELVAKALLKPVKPRQPPLGEQGKPSRYFLMESRSRRVIDPHTNEWVVAQEVDFRNEGEYWNTYLLSDGSQIKLKVVLVDVCRLPGDSEPDGTPRYVFHHTILNHASASAGDTQGK